MTIKSLTTKNYHNIIERFFKKDLSAVNGLVRHFAYMSNNKILSGNSNITINSQRTTEDYVTCINFDIIHLINIVCCLWCVSPLFCCEVFSMISNHSSSIMAQLIQRTTSLNNTIKRVIWDARCIFSIVYLTFFYKDFYFAFLYNMCFELIRLAHSICNFPAHTNSTKYSIFTHMIRENIIQRRVHAWTLEYSIFTCMIHEFTNWNIASLDGACLNHHM